MGPASPIDSAHARSEQYPLLKIGPFSNKYMLYAIASSLLLLLAVLYIPFLRQAFNTVPLGLEQWIVMLPLIFVPAIAAEVTKLFLRKGHSSWQVSNR